MMIQKLLFVLVVAAALGILAAPVVAPWVDSPSRIVALFAHDATVRRTALACGLGMLVTACVFFRSRPGRQGLRKPPPPGAVGA
jgi:hypothetical protein